MTLSLASSPSLRLQQFAFLVTNWGEKLSMRYTRRLLASGAQDTRSKLAPVWYCGNLPRRSRKCHSPRLKFRCRFPKSPTLELFRSVELRPGAIGRRTDVDCGFNACRLLVAIRNLIGKGLSICCLHQIYCGSTKSAAGHAPAVIAGKSFGDLDHNVQFAATDFVQVA